jgi:C4-type Zn-finger protein
MMELNYYMKDELHKVEVTLPCPGCGRLETLAMHVKVISYCNNKRKFHVGCSCGWEGPEMNIAERAALLWDARIGR